MKPRNILYTVFTLQGMTATIMHADAGGSDAFNAGFMIGRLVAVPVIFFFVIIVPASLIRRARALFKFSDRTPAWLPVWTKMYTRTATAAFIFFSILMLWSEYAADSAITLAVWTATVSLIWAIGIALAFATFFAARRMLTRAERSGT